MNTNDMDLTTVPTPTGINPVIWQLAIAFVTPVLIWLLRFIMPKVPSAVLPTITPLVGLALGSAMNWLGNAHLSPAAMSMAGALAVFVRETVNQWITKHFKHDDDSMGIPPGSPPNFL